MRASRSITVASFLGLVTTALLTGPVAAATLTLGASTQAWYRNRDGLNIRFFAAPSKDSIYPAFVGSYDDPDFGLFKYNSYFVFDLDDVESTIQGAKLRLPIKQYFSSKTTEEIAVFDVEASVEEIVNTPFSLRNYEDLGDGVEYGRQAVMVNQSLTDDEDTILLTSVEVKLSTAAIQAINTAINGAGKFAVGVSLASLDGSPYIFSTGAEGTEGVSISDGAREYPQFGDRAEDLANYEIPAELILEKSPPEDPKAIPEPTSILGFSLLGLGFATSRVWKRQ